MHKRFDRWWHKYSLDSIYAATLMLLRADADAEGLGLWNAGRMQAIGSAKLFTQDREFTFVARSLKKPLYHWALWDRISGASASRLSTTVVMQGFIKGYGSDRVLVRPERAVI